MIYYYQKRNHAANMIPHNSRFKSGRHKNERNKPLILAQGRFISF